MTDAADEPGARRALIVRAVMAHRREGGDPVVFAADGAPDARIAYDDRLLWVTPSAGERDRLDDLLGDYPVFKIKQPETRKAADGTVYVSAIADPKHVADFVEDCFRRVYGLEEACRLTANTNG